MKKVLIITYYWPPAGGPGVQRWLKFAKYLPEFGWEPIILTVDEDYASYPQKDYSLIDEVSGIEVHKTKSFEILNLYSSLNKEKQIPYGGFSNEGNPSLLKKVSRFVRGNLFIPDPRKGWNKYAYDKAVELIKEKNIETVVTTSPPHSTQLIGLELKQNLKINWIADLRDPWTDIFYYNKFYPTKLVRKIDRNLEEKVIRNCDKLITVSESIKNIYSERYRVAEKTHVLTNGFDTDDFPPNIFENNSIKKEFLYTGTVTSEYPLHEVVTLAKKMEGFSFRFVGNVPSCFIELIEKEGLKNQFVFQEAISHNKIVKEMVQAQILLLLIPKIDKNEGILTGKLFEYLGSKRPLVVIGPKNGDVEIIINETNSGAYFDYNSVETLGTSEISESIVRIYSDKYLEYSRQVITKKLVGIIYDL